MSSIELAYEKYCEERFALPSAVEVGALEQRLGGELPEHYREYLLQWNGGYFKDPSILPPTVGRARDCPSSTLVKMHGIAAPLDDGGDDSAEVGNNTGLWEGNDPVIVLPIGRTVMGAFIILMTGDENASDHGEVCLRTFDETFWLADTMEDFFSLFHDSRETAW